MNYPYDSERTDWERHDCSCGEVFWRLPGHDASRRCSKCWLEELEKRWGKGAAGLG